MTEEQSKNVPPTPETEQHAESTNHTIDQTDHSGSAEQPVVEGTVEVVEDAPATGQEAEEPQQVAQLQAQVEEYKDQWLRSVAEFKNYKRRAEAERLELRRSASAGLILKLLPIIDDFERAIENIPLEIQQHPWWSGTQLITQKLKALLESEGVTPIQALGQEFDPNLHDAVMYEEAPGQDNKVTAELQTGYMLHDRVLRPTMVKVGKG